MSLGGRKDVKVPVGYVNNGSSSDDVGVRAMIGEEEDILSNDNISFAKRIDTMVLNCIDRIGQVTDKAKIAEMYPDLTIEDQTTLLISLRAMSISETLEYAMMCPECKKPILFKLDLTSLKVTPGEAKKSFVNEVTLPSGRKCKVKPMQIKDRRRIEALETNGENFLSVAIWVRLVELDGKPNPTVQDVRAMMYGDRLALRGLFDRLEGSIESQFNITCQACGAQFDESLDVARPEFLLPKM